MDQFNYQKALERLEQIAKQIEDPSTGLDDMDKIISESQDLVEGCRNYLRSSREKIEKL